jgi:hypothetical protein
MLMTQRFVLLPARASPYRGLQPREQNWTSQYCASQGVLKAALHKGGTASALIWMSKEQSLSLLLNGDNVWNIELKEQNLA